jgi:hypothetical protein
MRMLRKGSTHYVTGLPSCECEAWSVTLTEKYRLYVFKNRVLKKIFRAKREEVTVGWRKLYHEGLHEMYCSSNIIRAIKSRMVR